MFDFSKDVSVDIIPRNETVYVRANIDDSPRSVIEGALNITVKKGLTISKISVSLWGGITVINDTSTFSGEPNYVRKSRFATQEVYSKSQSKSDKPEPPEYSINMVSKLSKHAIETSLKIFIWVPDKLEPTIDNKNLKINYYLEAEVAYNKGFLFYYMKSNAKARKPIKIYTLPHFLNLEQLKTHIKAPFSWFLFDEYNTKVFINLSSKILVNSKESPVNAILTIHDSSSSENCKAAIKSVSIALHQEIIFNTLYTRKQNSITKLFDVFVDCESKICDNECYKITSHQIYPCHLKISCMLKNKKYYNITFPFIASESISSIVLDELNINHFLRATVDLVPQDTGCPETKRFETPIIFITSTTEAFNNTLPPFPNRLNDIFISNCSAPSPPYIHT